MWRTAWGTQQRHWEKPETGETNNSKHPPNGDSSEQVDEQPARLTALLRLRQQAKRAVDDAVAGDAVIGDVVAHTLHAVNEDVPQTVVLTVKLHRHLGLEGTVLILQWTQAGPGPTTRTQHQTQIQRAQVGAARRRVVVGGKQQSGGLGETGGGGGSAGCCAANNA